MWAKILLAQNLDLRPGDCRASAAGGGGGRCSPAAINHKSSSYISLRLNGTFLCRAHRPPISSSSLRADHAISGSVGSKLADRSVWPSRRACGGNK